MGAPSAEGTPGVGLKVVSYNILEGGGERLLEILNVIRDLRPDVVALLEANSRRNVAAIARELNMQAIIGKANSKFHVAWLSRLPVRRSQNHRLPILSKTLLEIEVEWEGAPLRLFAAHLAGGADPVHPADEMPVVLEVLRPLAGQPHLLVGDLNSLHPDDPVGPPPFDVERMQAAIDADPRRAISLLLEAGYVDCYRVLHPSSEAPGYSYPTCSAWMRLDYAFASPELAPRIQACDLVVGVTTDRASDHYPLWVEFH